MLPHLPSQGFQRGLSNAKRLLFAFSDYESVILDLMKLPAIQLAETLSGALAPEDRPDQLDGHALYDHFVFRAPAMALADLASVAGVETYVLDYDYVPSGLRGRMRGAVHGAAIYAVLGAGDPTYATLGHELVEDDLVAATSIRERVLAFIRGQSPQSDGGLPWPPHRPGGPDALIVDQEGRKRIAAPAAYETLLLRGKRARRVEAAHP